MDLLRLGSSSLLNMQQALATTGHNISNANTTGFSRQSVNLSAQETYRFGYGSVGQGAYVSGVTRSTDPFMTAQVQNFASSESRYSTYLDYSTRLDDLMADANNSISSKLQQFWNSVQGVSTNPTGTPERQVMLSSANDLVTRLQTVDKSMRALGNEIDSNIRSTVNEINGLCDSVKQINLQIVGASVSGASAAPNDLLDQRDQLLAKLSEKVGITAVVQNDGSINVFAGKGQALVVGNEVDHLVVRSDPNDGSKLEISFASNPNGSGVSQFLQGGELQGLFEFRDRNMAQAESRVGLLALTLSSEFNYQHAKGLDLNSNVGGQFFNAPTFNVIANSANQGTTALTVNIADTTAIRASDYRVKYDGAAWHLTRMTDGTEVTGVGVLTLDGMTVDTSAGAPVAGDSFSFNPAKDAAANFQVMVRDPRLIAAASAIKGTKSTGNVGKGAIDNLQVTDPTKMPLATALTVTFDANALGAGLPGFVLSGAATGTLAYDPATDGAGKNFTLAGLGLSFRMSGSPTDGDSFTVAANNGSSSDNRNALALADIQNGKIINGQQDTLQSFYSALVSDVGINQQQADANHTVQSSLLTQAQQYKDSVSGVNLDEEAANMMRFQQAYQASAQMIKIADQIFNTLMESLR